MNEIEKAIKHLTMLRRLDSGEKKHLYDIAVSALEAQQADRWIPCKDRLPEEDGMYLITSDVLGKLEIQYCFYQINIKRFICNGKAVAWQPLPEPWKEEQL